MACNNRQLEASLEEVGKRTLPTAGRSQQQHARHLDLLHNTDMPRATCFILGAAGAVRLPARTGTNAASLVCQHAGQHAGQQVTARARREPRRLRGQFTHDASAEAIRSFNATALRRLSTRPAPSRNERHGHPADIRAAMQWEQVGENWVYRPSENPDDIRGIVHFVGGAFVGRVPQLSYRYLLEQIASKGFIIVATPHELNFDLDAMARGIASKLDAAMNSFAWDLWNIQSLPVIGVGHSLGALMQSYITSQRLSKTKRAGNVLISWNNKPATEAIPLFEPLVSPFLKQVGPFSGPISESAAFAADQALMLGERLVAQLPSFAPPILRDLPSLGAQLLPAIGQVQPLIEQISASAAGVEFKPSPEEMRAAIGRSYAAPRTLLVKFRDDSIDQSEDIRELLGKSGARGAGRVEFMELNGTHVEPLAQELPKVREVTGLELGRDADNVREAIQQQIFANWESFEAVLVTFLDSVAATPAPRTSDAPEL
eukprot:tig00001024_g6335.t1